MPKEQDGELGDDFRTGQSSMAQDANTASIKDGIQQKRVERVFKELNKFIKWEEKHSGGILVGSPDSTGGVIDLGETYLLIKMDYKLLKNKKE